MRNGLFSWKPMNKADTGSGPHVSVLTVLTYLRSSISIYEQTLPSPLPLHHNHSVDRELIEFPSVLITFHVPLFQEIAYI